MQVRPGKFYTELQQLRPSRAEPECVPVVALVPDAARADVLAPGPATRPGLTRPAGSGTVSHQELLRVLVAP